MSAFFSPVNKAFDLPEHAPRKDTAKELFAFMLKAGAAIGIAFVLDDLFGRDFKIAQTSPSDPGVNCDFPMSNSSYRGYAAPPHTKPPTFRVIEGDLATIEGLQLAMVILYYIFGLAAALSRMSELALPKLRDAGSLYRNRANDKELNSSNFWWRLFTALFARKVWDVVKYELDDNEQVKVGRNGKPLEMPVRDSVSCISCAQLGLFILGNIITMFYMGLLLGYGLNYRHALQTEQDVKVPGAGTIAHCYKDPYLTDFPEFIEHFYEGSFYLSWGGFYATITALFSFIKMFDCGRAMANMMDRAYGQAWDALANSCGSSRGAIHFDADDELEGQRQTLLAAKVESDDDDENGNSGRAQANSANSSRAASVRESQIGGGHYGALGTGPAICAEDMVAQPWSQRAAPTTMMVSDSTGRDVEVPMRGKREDTFKPAVVTTASSLPFAAAAAAGNTSAARTASATSEELVHSDSSSIDIL